MAEDDFLYPTEAPENTSVGTVGDFAKTVGAGALNVGSNLAATSRYFFDQGQSEHGSAISKALQDLLATGAGEITESMNPESKKLLESNLTSAEFWEHPLLGSALKVSGIVPSMAALAIPGGLMSSAIGATMVAAGGGAVLNAGSVIDEFYRKVDAATDEELADQSPYYKTLLETFPPEEARKRFTAKMLGMAPAINAVVGAAAGAVGPAGMAARALAGGTKATINAAERGAIGRGLAGAAEGAAANALQEGVADVTGQQSALEAGLQKEFDAVQALNRTLEGGAVGGILGGAVGAAAGRRGARASDAPAVVDAPEAAVTNEATPPQATNGTTGTASKPPENVAVGNPQSTPVRSERDGAKPQKGKSKGAKVAVVESAGPDAAQAAAIASDTPVPTPVAEAAQRVQQAQTPPAAPEPVPAQVTPEPAPAPAQAPAEVPPQVAAAEQRVAPEAVPVQEAPVDTGMNTPEQPVTIFEQLKQLIDGQRRAVMLPKGTPNEFVSRLPPSVRPVQTPRGIFIIDPNKTSPAEVLSLSSKGRENELLGLGPVSKAEAVARANAGETPVAVTERTPDGTEVRAAAGTDQTAPAQVAAIEQVKSPGNTVAVETPQQVLEGRAQPPRTGRVIKRDAFGPAEKVDLNKAARENLKGTEVDEQGNKVVKGRNMGPKARAAIEETRTKAEKIVADHPPADAEAEYIRGGAAKEAVIARARAMVAAADAAGVKIPSQIKVSAKGDQISDIPAIQKLRYAKDLVQAVKSKATGKKSTDAVARFKEREQAKPEEALAARRSEGEEAMRRDQGSVEDQASMVSAEDVRAEASEGAPDLEKNAVQTKAPKSAKGPLRGVDDAAETRTVKTKEGDTTEVEGAKAASEVRRPKLSKEEMDAILSRANAPLKKPVALAIKRAAAATERNPTEAQKVAGNYAKGHFKLHGLDVTLENPRGSMRRGVDDNGKPWSVKMPDHYGYIKRTNGADGDHIDVYVGPNPKSERVFVVDQLDTRTGNFDEHKVMMGFNDEAAALDSYTKAFSDGKGRERAGNITEMNISEFKDWLKNGDTTEPATMHAMEPGLGQELTGMFRTDKRRATMLTEPAAKTILDLDLTHLEGVPRRLAEFIKPHLARLVGDTPLHFIDPNDFADITGRAVGEARGMYVNDAEGPRIYIDAREAKHPEHVAHVVLHEAMHRAVHDAIEDAPQTKAVIRSMMNQTAEKLASNPNLFDKYGYAFTNEHEFMSEAFSNPGFQNLLAQIKVSDNLAGRLGLDTTSKLSMWDRVVGEVRNIIERVLGRKLPHTHQMISAVMRTGEHLFNARAFEMRVNAETSPIPRNYAPEQAHFLVREAADAVRNYIESPNNQTAENAPKLLKLRTFDNIAQMAAHFWRGEDNPVRKVHEAVEAMRVTGEKIFRGSEPIVRKLVDLRARHTTEQWDEFTALLHDATTANVHPDVPLTDAKNAHLGKDALKGKQAKYRHAELSRRFAAMSEDLRNAFNETTKHFADQQNKMTLGIINNQILHLMGIKDEALGQRIHEGTLDDADRARLGDMLPVIEEASELSKIEGPYVPLMRRGDFVVRGTYKVDVPPGAKRINENTVEFNSRKEATDYAAKHELTAKIKSVWVDGTTGELHVKDPKTGKDIKVLKDDTDSVNKFRVTLQDQHVEFFKTKREAEARAAELKQELGDRIDLKGVAPRRYEPDGRPAADLSTSLGRLAKKLEGTPAWKDATPQQRNAMRSMLTEASISSLGSTRIQSKSLPRRGVKGYSHDIVQNTYDYALSSSRYLARLEHAPELEAGVKAMNSTIDQDASKNLTYGRQAIANEVLQRVEGNNGFEQGGAFSQVTKRLLAISFIDKLGSPAYSVINATQPGMVTMPWLAGRHGVGRSFSALGKAYSDIAALKIVKQAGAETGRRIKGQGRPDDFISDIKNRLTSADEKAMIDEHVRLGLIDPSAGMEIADLVRDTSGIGGKVDTAISYLEGVTREMPRAIEAINRAATALAAYRLERSRGASHDKAVQYSKDAVNNTQFNYSPTNAPKIFNHPVAKIALQFKKYGQGMYQLMGMQIGKAIRNAEPGDRKEAIRTLAGIAATHMAMAGALGLPTEPFKYLVMGANAVGLTGLSWGDVEDRIRRATADVLGAKGGEVFSRGLPRLLNLDLARMGLDSVTSFGEPRSNKEADVKTWLFDSLAGPVVSLGGDWIKGLQNITNGNFEKAAEQMIPIKAASDALRAYRQVTEGKKSASGRDVMSGYTPTEAALRTLGFGNAREAEIGAKRSAYYSGSSKFKEERSALISAWVGAKPSEKSKAFIEITKWNRTVPEEARIKPAELSQKEKRTSKEKSSLVNGVRATKKDKFILDRTSIYNTGA